MRFIRTWMICWVLSLANAARATPVRILGASSLTEGLTEFTEGRSVSLAFGGSGSIANQVLAGAPVDILVLAHPDWMQKLDVQGHVHTSVAMLGNQLVLATRPGHAPSVQNLSTLHHADRIAIGSNTTPAGMYAKEAISAVGLEAQLQPKLVHTNNVRAVLAHIESGTVDAGFVYRTDLRVAPSLESRFIIDPGLHTPIEVVIVLTTLGANNPAAVTLFDELTGDAARRVFQQYGFRAAPGKLVEPKSKASPMQPLDTKPILLSVWVAGSSLLISIVPALGLAWLMARREFRGKALLSTLCLSPLVLPPVVTGWLLLKAASYLSLPIAFTKWAAVIAAAVVGFPLLFILTRQAIESIDTRYARLGETLGLSPFQAFYSITLPMARSGIAAGCVLAFARALGEFGATAMLAGDQPGETRTLALAVYALTEQPGGNESATILVGFSVLITLVALLSYEKLVWRQRLLSEETS